MSTYDVVGKSYDYAKCFHGTSGTLFNMTKKGFPIVTTDIIAFDSIIGNISDLTISALSSIINMNTHYKKFKREGLSV